MKHNPFLSEETAAYLVANGYKKEVSEHSNVVHFFKDDKRVAVINDAVDFMEYHCEEEGQQKAGFYRYQAHTGISNLSLFDWMLLLHIADVVPLKQFIAKAKREAEHEKISGEILNSMQEHFGQIPMGVPECY